MKVICPTCQQPIGAEQINVAKDVAFCQHCDQAFSLAELVATGEVDEEELGEPPKGCWFDSNLDDWEVGATTRSYAAWFLVPFMCVWSGFSLGGIYGSQIVKGEFDLELSLFGIPFLLGTILFGSIALLTVCGKAVLKVRDDQAEAFIGVGPIGWCRRFQWSQITRVVEDKSTNEGQSTWFIRLEGVEKRIKFAYGVSEERRGYLLRFLRRMLVKAKS